MRTSSSRSSRSERLPAAWALNASVCRLLSVTSSRSTRLIAARIRRCRSTRLGGLDPLDDRRGLHGRIGLADDGEPDRRAEVRAAAPGFDARVATPIGVDNVRKVRFSASTCGRSGSPSAPSSASAAFSTVGATLAAAGSVFPATDSVPSPTGSATAPATAAGDTAPAIDASRSSTERDIGRALIPP